MTKVVVASGGVVDGRFNAGTDGGGEVWWWVVEILQLSLEE